MTVKKRPSNLRWNHQKSRVSTGHQVSCYHPLYGRDESKLRAVGTGKTHTLIEVIRQLTSVTSVNPKPLRVLICGASNLAVDNILERLLALPVTKSEGQLMVTRVGHPARVMSNDGVLDSTLDMKAGRSDEVSEVGLLYYDVGSTGSSRRHSRKT